ncbi:hypothetical protein FQA39_LY04728 [Lamprigera yunnana]|nr:hypothetical protein FQA39_LY04728 [Lamprigera yunnana]
MDIVEDIIRGVSDINLKTDENTKEDIKISFDDLWNIASNSDTGIDYEKLMRGLGSAPIDEPLLERFERITGKPVHYLLRRGKFFSHLDMHNILDQYEAGQPFYLYNGRGLSLPSLHIGHLIPFMLCKWLQEVFDIPVIIQLVDYEKFKLEEVELENANKLAHENAKDIIALGFDIDKTFVFSSLDHYDQCPRFYRNVTRIEVRVACNDTKGTFGIYGCGTFRKITFLAFQFAPAISTSFPHIFGDKFPCLIPCAIEQDPYFRNMRDVIPTVGYQKPALLYSVLFPALQGSKMKISASDNNSTVFLTDTVKQVKNKIYKCAVSGEQATVEEHRELGGNCDIDISYQYLTFLLEDEEKLEQIGKDYSSGVMLSKEVKNILIDTIKSIIQKHQEERSKITDEILKKFMTPRKLNFSYKKL